MAKGDIVKVFSPSLKDCCRAKVISIEESGDCSVFYVDFGSTEIVSLSNVFKLSDDLKKIVLYFNDLKTFVVTIINCLNIISALSCYQNWIKFAIQCKRK